MNRKLHNSLLAFSTTGLMLILGMMAATPMQRAGQDRDVGPTAMRLPAIAATRDGRATLTAAPARPQAIEARIDARAERLQAELDHSASLGDTIASVTAFAAEVSTDAALNAVIKATDESEHTREAENEEARHAKRVRGVLAVPYFSFAQGLRRNSRS